MGRPRALTKAQRDTGKLTMTPAERGAFIRMYGDTDDAREAIKRQISAIKREDRKRNVRESSTIHSERRS